jgi:starch synthase
MHQYTSHYANLMADDNDVFLVTTAGYPEDRYSPEIAVQTPIVTGDTGLSLAGLSNVRLAAVRSALEELQPDIVHITGPYLWNILIIRWLRRKGIPSIHTIHDLDPHAGAGYGNLLHLWNRLITNSVDKILVHGERYRQRLIEKGVTAESVVSIPLLHSFVGFANLPAARDASLKTSYEKSILFFGRIEKYKGVEDLLEAFVLMRSRIDPEQEPPKLILAGAGNIGGAWAAHLPAGVEWRDHFIEDGEAIELFRTCSLVVLPYVDGTQSALIPSAYYFNKPVVATSVGALSEYVDHRTTGYIVDPRDPEAISQTFVELFADESILRTMGIAGRGWYDNQRELETSSLVDLYH